VRYVVGIKNWVSGTGSLIRSFVRIVICIGRLPMIGRIGAEGFVTTRAIVWTVCRGMWGRERCGMVWDEGRARGIRKGY
jgi:hypothetical protein